VTQRISSFANRAFYHALDSVPEVKNVEVDEQSHADSAEAHVGQELRFVNGMYGVCGFHFDDDSGFDKEIDSISELKFVALINNWQGHFCRDLESSTSQFVRKAALVGTFQEPWTEYGVNFHYRGYYEPGDLVYCKGVMCRTCHAYRISQFRCVPP